MHRFARLFLASAILVLPQACSSTKLVPPSGDDAIDGGAPTEGSPRDPDASAGADARDGSDGASSTGETTPRERIAGRVTGSLAEPLENLDVLVVDAAGREHRTRTDARGQFAFTEVTPPYDLRVTSEQIGRPHEHLYLGATTRSPELSVFTTFAERGTPRAIRLTVPEDLCDAGCEVRVSARSRDQALEGDGGGQRTIVPGGFRETSVPYRWLGTDAHVVDVAVLVDANGEYWLAQGTVTVGAKATATVEGLSYEAVPSIVKPTTVSNPPGDWTADVWARLPGERHSFFMGNVALGTSRVRLPAFVGGSVSAYALFGTTPEMWSSLASSYIAGAREVSLDIDGIALDDRPLVLTPKMTLDVVQPKEGGSIAATDGVIQTTPSGTALTRSFSLTGPRDDESKGRYVDVYATSDALSLERVGGLVGRFEPGDYLLEVGTSSLRPTTDAYLTGAGDAKGESVVEMVRRNVRLVR